MTNSTNDLFPHGVGSRQAYMAIDMLFGIIIVVSVTIALVTTVRHERSAENALAGSRSALHLAEHTLLNLQHNQSIPVVAADIQLTIHPTKDGTAPAGFVWAKVDVSIDGHHQSLLGVVPTGSITPGTKS